MELRFRVHCRDVPAGCLDDRESRIQDEVGYGEIYDLQVRTLLVPGAGHTLHYDKPKEVAEGIRDFLLEGDGT